MTGPSASQIRLIATRRLLPLFVAQFLGALNDNLFRNALGILIEYRYIGSAATIQGIVTLATGLFILPYFLFSATAGQLADKYEKTRLVRAVKLWEVGVMALAALGFLLGSFSFGLFVLFLLGVQAAFFGPVKYAILPDLLGEEELLAGNALIEAGTYIAILIGTIAGGLLILAVHGRIIVAGIQLAVALAGWAVSFLIPSTRAANPSLRLSASIPSETWTILRQSLQRPAPRAAILGISWFWLVGAVFVGQFPNFARYTLAADNQVVTLFLMLFSIGIGAGSLLCGRLLRGRITLRYLPIAALGMAVFAADLFFASNAAHGNAAGLADARTFLQEPRHWRILGDLLALTASGGFFVVPLYALLQARSPAGERSRMVAANNIWNALFMVAAFAATAAVLRLGATVPQIFLMVAVANIFVAAWTVTLRRLA